MELEIGTMHTFLYNGYSCEIMKGTFGAYCGT